MTFADTARFLYSLGPELKTVKWSLDRIELLLAALDSPHKCGARFYSRRRYQRQRFHLRHDRVGS